MKGCYLKNISDLCIKSIKNSKTRFRPLKMKKIIKILRGLFLTLKRQKVHPVNAYFGLNKILRTFIFLGLILFFNNQIVAQTLDFIPDSVKIALGNLPESDYDSIYYDLGSAFYAQYNDEGYNRALACFRRGLAYSEKYKHQLLIREGNFLIGTVYDAYKEDPEKIVYYYKKAYDMAVAMKDEESVLGLSYNVAHAYNIQSDFANSMRYVSVFDSIRRLDPKSSFWNRGGVLVAYLQLKNKDKAGFIKTFEGLDKNYKYVDGNKPFARYFALCSASYAFETGDYGQAITILNKTLSENPTDSAVLMQYLAQSYARSGDMTHAYEWMVKLDKLNGRNLTLSARKGLVVNLLRTDNALQDKENELLALEKISKEKQNSLLAFGMIFFVFATGIVAWFWYDNFKDKRELAKRNAEKALLVQEIHHRVKNNLQLMYGLAKMQLPTISDPNARDLWQKNLIQLKSMSLVNEKLYNTEGVTAVVIKDFILEILAYYRQIFPSETALNIQTNIDEKLIVEADFAIPFGLILTELITNSYKYGLTSPKPSIDIRFQKTADNKIEFSYADTGKIDDISVLSTKKTGGSALIRDLVRQLKGTMTIKNDNNLTYNILFPT
jgi:two-component sensor histidine kinase